MLGEDFTERHTICHCDACGGPICDFEPYIRVIALAEFLGNYHLRCHSAGSSLLADRAAHRAKFREQFE